MSEFKTNLDLAIEESDTFLSQGFKCERINDVKSELKSNTGYAIKQAIKYSQLDTVEKSQILKAIYNKQQDNYSIGCYDEIHMPHGKKISVSLYEKFIDSITDINKVLLKIENSVSNTPPYNLNMQPHYVKLDSHFTTDFFKYHLYRRNQVYERATLELFKQKQEEECRAIDPRDGNPDYIDFEYIVTNNFLDDPSDLKEVPGFNSISFKKKWFECYRNHDYKNLGVGNRIAKAAANIARQDLKTSGIDLLTPPALRPAMLKEKFETVLDELISQLTDYSNDSANLAEKIADSKIKEFDMREDFKEEVSLDSLPADGVPING